MSQIKDIFFIKTILDRATAGSHNGETGYYSVSDNMFSEGHSCYCDNGNDYYNDLKGIFDCATTDFSCPGFGQVELESGNYPMTIVKLAGVDHLTLLFSGITINLNFDGNYYYTQNNYSSYGGALYRFDYVDGEIEYVKTYSGGSYATVTENVETTLYSSMPIMMYYNNADRNINYARIDGDQGVGSGGWQVPNPNPTRKIVLNGVNYSDANPEDPNYNWYYNDDKTLIVRESKADRSFRWYFNDFAVTASSSPFQTLPSNLQPFIKNGVGVECSVRSGGQSVGYIGFHDNTIRLWNTGWGSNFTGICKGIMESTDTSGASHTWEEPNMPTVKIIKLNGVTPDKIMLNGVCYFEKELPPKQTLVRLDYTNNDHPTSNISVSFPDADDNMAIDNFFLDLKSYRFAGSYSTVWNSNVTLNSYSTANKTLSMSWGTMSGSSQQNFDIVEVPDPTRLTVLQDWTVINQGTTLELDLPSAYASRITTDDILIDFKEIHTYESLNGGSWITISRAIQNGKLVLTIPDYFAANSYYSIRVLCSL